MHIPHSLPKIMPVQLSNNMFTSLRILFFAIMSFLVLINRLNKVQCCLVIDLIYLLWYLIHVVWRARKWDNKSTNIDIEHTWIWLEQCLYLLFSHYTLYIVSKNITFICTICKVCKNYYLFRQQTYTPVFCIYISYFLV